MLSIQELISFFWDTEGWFGPAANIQYLELEDEYYTEYRDLYTYPIPITLGILLFRFVVEKFCFCQLGLSVGLKNVKNKKPIPNAILEKAFKKGNRWTHKDIVSLAKQTDFSERQIERWLRLRKLQDKPSPLYRFSECCWRCFYFSNAFFYGLIVLWSKPWFWNLDYCWTNYPYQAYTLDIWWYYMVSLGFYSSLIVYQIFNMGKKDFWPTLFYNSMAVILLTSSWICNAYRIGAIVILLHDASDAFLNVGKALKYVKHGRLCSVVFWMFILVWAVTRLMYYPFWILYSTIYRAPVIAAKLLPGYYVFKTSLIGLFIMNLYWIYSVSRVIDQSLR